MQENPVWLLKPKKKPLRISSILPKENQKISGRQQPHHQQPQIGRSNARTLYARRKAKTSWKAGLRTSESGNTMQKGSQTFNWRTIPNQSRSPIGHRRTYHYNEIINQQRDQLTVEQPNPGKTITFPQHQAEAEETEDSLKPSYR